MPEKEFTKETNARRADTFFDAYYTAIASHYNELHGEEQLRKLRIIKEFLEKHNLLVSSDTILDVGCGTGLSAQVFKNNIIGVEPSELANQAPFLVKRCKAEQLPFEDSSFDIVICVTALHNMNSQEKAVQEIKRVGRKLFVVTILKKSSKLAELEKLLAQQFVIIAELDDLHDKIFILKQVKTQHAASIGHNTR